MKGVFYIPNGPKNLATLFPGVNFADVEEYYLEVKDSAGTLVATTTSNRLELCADDDRIRIHFLNYLGTVDALNFTIETIEHEARSETTEAPTTAPLVRSQHAVGRFNVKSNDIYTAVTVDYDERDQDWIDELMDSPVAWLEWKGEQGQADDYLPIVVHDIKRQKRKEEERYTYEVTLQFRLSHDKFTIRN